jgi:protein-S-isoprenylcysteine O-methyltransferase Ste14
MRALDDILIGFFIFFAIDRAIRLFSSAVVEPWAQTKTGDKSKVENWKTGAELIMLLVALLVVFKMRGVINKA